MSDSPETQVAMVSNLNILANATALATRVIMATVGDSTASTIGGEAISEPFVADAVAARMQAALAPYVGGV